MTTRKRATLIWSEIMEDVMFHVPVEVRDDVLSRLAAGQAKRKTGPRFKIESLAEIVKDFETNPVHRVHNATMEARSLIVQVLTRIITNNHSDDDAARILFRCHRHGTGSGRLHEYLDGLPGIKIDRKKAESLSQENGASRLPVIRSDQAGPDGPS